MFTHRIRQLCVFNVSHATKAQYKFSGAISINAAQLPSYLNTAHHSAPLSIHSTRTLGWLASPTHRSTVECLLAHSPPLKAYVSHQELLQSFHAQHRYYSTQAPEEKPPEQHKSDGDAHGEDQHEARNSLPDLHPIHKHTREHGKWNIKEYDDMVAHVTHRWMHTSKWLEFLPHSFTLATFQAWDHIKIAAHNTVSFFMRNKIRQQLQEVEVNLQDNIEQEFSIDEFQQGCKDAVAAVIESYGAADWEALQEMVSEEMLAAMKQHHERFAAGGKVKVLALEPEVQRVEPRGIGMWSSEHVSSFDTRWTSSSSSSSSTSGLSSSSWLVAVVYVKALVTHRLQAVRRDREIELKVHRAGFWVFTRGPLPVRAVRELDCPWQVVGTW